MSENLNEFELIEPIETNHEEPTAVVENLPGAEAAQTAEASIAADAPTAELTEVMAVPVPEPLDPAEREDLTKRAYAMLAEELKHKGDFPEWEAISERAKTLYLEAVDTCQAAGHQPRTRFEEIVMGILHGAQAEPATE